MIEAYAFLAVFVAQIIAMSVVQPARLSRYVRVQASSLPAERLAKLYPGVDLDLARERFLTRYGVANTAIAVLGFLLLGWLVFYMRQPTWHEDPVIILSAAYFMIQYLPVLVAAWLGFRFNRTTRNSLLVAKRTATLERRGLFDFVSPLAVFVAALAYFSFVAGVIYFQQKPQPGLPLIVVLTLTYAMQSIVVYRKLYGKKSTPFETQAGRVHAIGMTVKSCVYGCIVCAVFFAFVFTVDLLDQKKWVPLAQSVCLLISTLMCLMGLTLPPKEPDAELPGQTRVS